MNNYEVLINPTPTLLNCPHSYQGYFFNTRAHLHQQSKGKLVSFFLRKTKPAKIVAAFHIFIYNGVGYSPGQAPFGGLEFDPTLRLEVLDFFWQEINAFLQTQALQSLHIKLYAQCYQPENTQVLQYLWLQHGFSIAEHNLNYHIDINAQALSERLHTSEQRRLRKCKTLGYEFGIWTSPDFEWVHQFVQACRQRKGFPVSLSAEALQTLYARFPDHFTLFTLRHQQRIIALATGVRVSPDILYYFLPADDAQYLSASPMVALLEGIYTYAQANNYQMLDLGISTEYSMPNHGLINFKKHMGAEASLKLTFVKEFERF
jgi:hypothetical protein